MTQGKIERYHRSMKNVVKLETFYFPWDLEQAIKEFVDSITTIINVTTNRWLT